FSAGSEKSNLRLSLNNTQTSGILPNSNLDKTTVNFNGSSEITDKFKMDASVNFTITDGFNRPAVGYTGESVILQLYQFGQTSLDYERLKKYKTPDGRQRTWNRISAENPLPRFTDNPYWVLNENIATDKRTRWYGSVGGTYNFTDNLYAVAKLYGDTYSFDVNQWTAVGSQAQPSYEEEKRTFQELNYEGRLHYDKTVFEDKLSINSFVGMNRRDNDFSRLSAFSNGGLVVPEFYNISNSQDNPTVTEFDSQRRINSVFGSVSLGYDNFAYVTITGRNDWSSTLPAGNNSYFYPSFNGSFVLSRFINADWLSFAKIRGGYAEVGSDTSPYQLINTFVGENPFLGEVPFTVDSDNRNAALQPEEKQTYEVGLELALFKNRFSLDLTYYDEVTNDLITGLEVDPSTGFEETVVNAGQLQNKGIELLVKVTPIQTENFSWDFTWNYAKNDNELLSLSEGIETLQLASYPFNAVSLNAVVGERYGQIRGTNYVFDDAGNRVVDADGRYAETRDVENLGSVLPDYNMGFRNSFSYKNLSASFLIDVQQGGKFRSLTNIWGNYSGILENTAEGNIREEGLVLEGVTGDIAYKDDGTYTVSNTAPNTTVISAQQAGQDHFFRNDNQNVFDADYVKLREVTLAYDIPVKFVKAIKSAKISAFGRNLLVWGLDNDNFDPEIATTGSGNAQGSEGGSLPSTRTYGLNLQLKF
ncbi:MAG: SusC/RagA family TonB-linked outer membrane protein, partial [Pricia sp.]